MRWQRRWTCRAGQPSARESGEAASFSQISTVRGNAIGCSRSERQPNRVLPDRCSTKTASCRLSVATAAPYRLQLVPTGRICLVAQVVRRHRGNRNSNSNSSSSSSKNALGKETISLDSDELAGEKTNAECRWVNSIAATSFASVNLSNSRLNGLQRRLNYVLLFQP